MRLFSRSRGFEPAGLLVFSLFALNAGAAESGWGVARDAHFEIYSEAGTESARAARVWFEQLRAFFLQQGFDRDAGSSRVRVIGFASEQTYSAFRLRPAADAYYAAFGDQQYVVLPGLEPRRFSMAAHEYAHVVLHASAPHLPLWLSEGLAEYFSTVRIGPRGTEIGGDSGGRSEILAHGKWIPFEELFSADATWLARQSPQQTAQFYAESWAITDALVSTARRSAQFAQLVRALDAAGGSANAIVRIYGISPSGLTEMVRARKTEAMTLPAVSTPELRADAGSASDYEVRFLLADLLAADGELRRAETSYRALLLIEPNDPDLYAALGNAALREGNKAEAAQEWRVAIAKGVRDAELCDRYAMLAAEQGIPESEIRPALERAIALKPDFDDARYTLALLESNAGEFEAALAQLHAMGEPGQARAFGYWSAIAYAATELGRREEAGRAAQHALGYAETPAERARALEAAYIARTDLMVQFARDQNGATRLITTRVPHGTSNFNPFIEPEDRIESTTGKLSQVECDGGRLTGFVVVTAQGMLSLQVPDPARVQMRNGSGEFTCGVQAGQAVRVEYAAQGNVLRGMEFQ